MSFSQREPLPSYKGYKNKVFDRHLHKMKDTCQQIRECSLKADDKIKLKQLLTDLLNETK